MLLLETVMDFIFIFDIFVNFRTAYQDDITGELVTDDWDVANVSARRGRPRRSDRKSSSPDHPSLSLPCPLQHYLRSWFTLDVVSGIPFGLLDMEALSKLSMLKILKGTRVLKAVKLLRFLKLSRLIKGSKFLSSLDAETIDRYYRAPPPLQQLLLLLLLLLLLGPHPRSLTRVRAC